MCWIVSVVSSLATLTASLARLCCREWFLVDGWLVFGGSFELRCLLISIFCVSQFVVVLFVLNEPRGSLIMT